MLDKYQYRSWGGLGSYLFKIFSVVLFMVIFFPESLTTPVQCTDITYINGQILDRIS